MRKNNSNLEEGALVNALDHSDTDHRIATIKKLMRHLREGNLPMPRRRHNVNNHIHTTYSFSPYTPSKALWTAYNSGLETAGIMDHDSVAGAREFIESGRIIGMGTTVGVELRVNAANTRLSQQGRINNPDQDAVIYMAIHGIPHSQLERVQDFLTPVRTARNERNTAMVERINDLIQIPELKLSMETDVIPISMAHEGGSITERHILFALGQKFIDRFGAGTPLLQFLENTLEMIIPDKVRPLLSDPTNDYLPYDLLGVLKSTFVPKMYIPADAELIGIRTAVDFAAEIGGISAYAYLGDVGQSVTGDKKPQKFEDDFLDLLFEELKNIGFNAVTYMPSRNTEEQLRRIKSKCREHQFFQISGEDINSPRQQFICEALKDPEFKNLFDATYALIGHEKQAGLDLNQAMFSKDVATSFPNLNERIAHYAAIGREEVAARNLLMNS